MKKNVMIIVIIAAIVALILLIFAFTYNPSSNNPPANNASSENNTQLPETSGETKTVQIMDFVFLPQTITINAGDTVQWTNKDVVSHQITSDSGDIPAASGNFGKDMTYSYTFTTAGTYNYHCGLHRGMKGKVIVE